MSVQFTAAYGIHLSAVGGTTVDLQDTTVIAQSTGAPFDGTLLRGEAIHSLDSFGTVTINHSQLTGIVLGFLSQNEPLTILGSQINGDVRWPGWEMTLDEATIEGNASVGAERAQVAVLRSYIEGGLSVTGPLNLETSVVKGDLSLSSSTATLASSQVAGKVVLTPSSTAICSRVFDGNLALRPANCVTP